MQQLQERFVFSPRPSKKRIWAFLCSELKQKEHLFIKFSVLHKWALLYNVWLHARRLYTHTLIYIFIYITKYTTTKEIRRYCSHYGDQFRTHPNHLAVNLLRLPDNRLLRRFLLLICLTDSNELFSVVILVLSYLLVSPSLLTHEALNLFIWRCATEHSSSCL
jgi:hypothetical protein